MTDSLLSPFFFIVFFFSFYLFAWVLFCFLIWFGFECQFIGKTFLICPPI